MSCLFPELYDARFNEREVSAKAAVWREIVRYLQRYVDPLAPVLDIGCDRGHFIRWSEGSERWARTSATFEMRFRQMFDSCSPPDLTLPLSCRAATSAPSS